LHLSEIVRRQAAARPQDWSYSCAEGSHTWASTDERSSRLASYLHGQRLQPGDRVAIVAKACHRYWEIHFACAKAGLIAVPVNYRLTADEVAYIVTDVGARAAIVGPGLGPLLATAPELPVRIGFGSGHGQPADYEQVLASASTRPPDVALHDHDINVIGYTSGTTGRPKGAMLSHRGSVLSAYGYGIANRFTADDVVLSCMPSYVFRGQSASLSPALVGAHVIMAEYRAAEILRLIERWRVTQIQLAPAMINLLLAEPGVATYDLSSLRAIWTGGAPIKSATLRRLGDLVGDVLGSTFGMTEATGIAGMRHRLSQDPRDERRLGSIGRPLPLLDVEVRRPDGTLTAAEEVGEIVVRGDTVMLGYWNDPELTATVLRDGWYHTGDLAWRDDEGYLYIVDRRVDIINSGGINVYSLEVEQVLDRMPGLLEAAVVGRPHDLWGEAVCAFVVRDGSARVDEQDVIDFCRGRLAHYKAPRVVEFRSELPRNAMGKLDKRALRAALWAGEERAVSG
jgi:long-chain acyl-CoA synthetase